MARKRLEAGANATRVEERIAKVPLDAGTEAQLVKPGSGSSATKAGASGRREAGIQLTRAEREMLVRCCVEYRNRLPIYLKSAAKEVALIDSVLKKFESD